MTKTSLALLVTALVVQHANAGQSVTTFESHVRPILKAHCFECHGDGAKLKGGLDVRLAHLLQKGGKNSVAFAPGDIKDSALLDRLRVGEMPPGKRKLTKDEIAVIERWIAGGAKTERPEPKSLTAGFQITEAEQAFWSFQPIRNPAPPRVKDDKRLRSPIDAFLLARLEKEGMSFSGEADARTLLRRLYFDLIGLPPTLEEIADFEMQIADWQRKNAQSESRIPQSALEKVVDRLLASPQYGERWGRMWLDVAR
jgi:mono/diheme cytochrome c family protein